MTKRAIAAGWEVEKLIALARWAWKQHDAKGCWNAVHKSSTVCEFLASLPKLDKERNNKGGLVPVEMMLTTRNF